MINQFKMLAAAAAITALPMTASAVTLSATNNIADGNVGIDINAGPYFFGADFQEPDMADTYTFEFVNNSSSAQTIATVIGTVLQFTAEFVGGANISWIGGDSIAVVQGQDITGVDVRTTLAANGGTDTLVVTFGDTSGAGVANIDLSVAAVPVPAAGLLLLGALGGVAGLRRRKKA